MTTAEDAAAVLAATVALTRALVEDTGDIVAAPLSGPRVRPAGVEPDLAMAYQEGMARRRP